MNQKFLNTLYKILGIHAYNSEKREVLERILFNFLQSPEESLDIKQEVNHIVREMEEECKIKPVKSISFIDIENKPMLKFFFSHPSVFIYSVTNDSAEFYCKEKYSGYSQEFRERYDINLSSILQVSKAIMLLLFEKSKKVGFSWDICLYLSKYDYLPNHIEIPPERYINCYSKTITINLKEDLVKLLQLSNTTKHEIHSTLKLMSSQLNDFSNANSPFIFLKKPLLEIRDDVYIVLTPDYLVRGLPLRYETLMWNIKRFRDRKGKIFEKMALRLLSKIPKSSLRKNIPYDSYELDGLLNLRKSTWFVEIASHPLSEEALTGNIEKIIIDLKKSLWHAERQAIRAYEYFSQQKESDFPMKKVRGCLILLDGLYPSINENPLVKLWTQPKNIKRYAINFFDLYEILKQPEINKFEEFLLWRSQPDLPILTFDEKDCWAFYFDRYKKDRKLRESLKKLSNMNTTLVYTSPRFNDKRYLKYLTYEQLRN